VFQAPKRRKHQTFVVDDGQQGCGVYSLG